jgi:hypothetical protein
MSFLRKLFGGGETPPGAPPAIEHRGYTIRATPYPAGAEWQMCGEIERTIDGQVRQHRFVRADRFGSQDMAVEQTLEKGRRIVDQLGDSVFGPP